MDEEGMWVHIIFCGLWSWQLSWYAKSVNRLQIKNHGLKDDQSLALGESILADVIVFIFTH